MKNFVILLPSALMESDKILSNILWNGQCCKFYGNFYRVFIPVELSNNYPEIAVFSITFQKLHFCRLLNMYVTTYSKY